MSAPVHRPPRRTTTNDAGPVALTDLLALPSLRNLRWIAGVHEAQVRRVVGRVGPAQSVARGLPAASGDDAPGLALVLLTPVERFDAAFDVLLRRGAQTGVTVVVTSGEGPPPGAGTATLAERLGVALVATTDPWAVSVRIHELLTDADGPAARLALDVATAALESGPGLEETFRDLEDTLGHRLCFLDATGRTIRGDLDLPEPERRVLASRATVPAGTVLPVGGGEVVAVPVGSGIGPRAWLGVLLPVSLPAERHRVLAALRVAAIGIGHRLVLTRLTDERDARYRTSMLDELRSVEQTVPPSLVQRTIAAGWRLDEWHIGVRLVAREPADFVALRRQAEEALRAQELDAVVVEQLDGWAAWVSTDTEPRPAEIRDTATRVRRAQVALRVSVDTDVGVGSVQAGALGLVRTLAEATDAAHLAAGRPEAGHFVHVDRLGLAQLLLAWTHTDTFLPAAQQLLAPLDRATGSLRTTLAAYLDAESSLAETAAVLGVHRNTVADRIARIERILGVDLRDPETRLALHLASRTRLPGGDGERPARRR